MHRIGDPAMSGQDAKQGRALIVVSGSVNYFYDRVGTRLASALASLDFAVEVRTLKDEPAAGADWAFFVNPYEIAVGFGDKAEAARRMKRIRVRSRQTAGVLLECATTPWFGHSLEVCRAAGIDDLLDLGFHSQHRDIPGDLRADYRFAFNGLTAEERAAVPLEPDRDERPIPWVFVGHVALPRLRLVEQLLLHADPGGFVYMPRLEPVKEDGPHINGQTLAKILSRARTHVWCSHHEHFYLESERFRDALLAGCLPVKVVAAPPLEDLLFPEWIVSEDQLPERWPAFAAAGAFDAFAGEFLTLPTLEESLAAALELEVIYAG